MPSPSPIIALPYNFNCLRSHTNIILEPLYINVYRIPTIPLSSSIIYISLSKLIKSVFSFSTFIATYSLVTLS